MMDYWTLTGLSNQQISEAFLTSIQEEIDRLREMDVQEYGEEKNPVVTHEKVRCFVLWCCANDDFLNSSYYNCNHLV